MAKRRKAARSSLSVKAPGQAQAKDKKVNAGLTRRGFMQGVGVAGGVAAVGTRAAKAAAARPKVLPAKKTPITLHVNGKDRKLSVEPRLTLLRALRNDLDLTGPKEICDRGACGGCSVLLDGDLVTSCMTLAVDAVGKKITTIEGLSDGNKLHPIQEAFVKHDALQCGFCTPGMVMACKALLDKNKNPDLVQIKKGLAGNICRCGTYNRIFAAVQTASKAV
jgi:aerobic-type carbon monoxide dehydrogenase small subunit (CoxS/CutS family)